MASRWEAAIQGLFLLPMVGSRGWSRGDISLAFGLQTLVWGILQPLTGALADRFGATRVIAIGCVCYAAGLLIESTTTTPLGLVVGAGLLVGAALTATSFGVVYGAVARLAQPSRRGWTLGVAGGLAGVVQFLLVPIAQFGISTTGWQWTLQAIAVAALVLILVAPSLNDRKVLQNSDDSVRENMLDAVKAALRHRGFWLLNLGFISCGFQLAFLRLHLPAYLKDDGLPSSVAVTAIALIALSNAIGIYFCGALGHIFRRKYLLATVYAFRTLAMLLFVLVPVSPLSVYLFTSVMGLTWLGTVPLTSGVLAQIFGVRYISTLFGLVFLGHQLGGFLGAWLGGYIYETTHSYSATWFISIVLGVASVLFNIPINDTSIEDRLRAQPV